jgi:glycyl-radical enzyme activating protein
MTTAPLVEIKRFAVHDGPGIRSTVFLKGCSLHCRWCHNPESICAKPELALLKQHCTLCGECVKFCPCHSIVDGEHKIDRQCCTGCGKCLDVCLFGALEHYGAQLSAAAVAQELLEDRSFYDYSGGGVTLSGGEPLLYPEFCAELLALLKKENIHTAIDTCGKVPWTSIKKVLPYSDLFLYDFKHASSEAHRQLTGSGNELLLENLRRLSQTGKPIEIRMIMIPTLNMSAPDLEAAAQILSALPHITQIKLLPYHSFAAAKYESVGHINTMPKILPPNQQEMQTAAQLLHQKSDLPVITD